jgi:histidine phosphotransferase ChpT
LAASTETLLTELLVSRLCHDLISPVGAIGNGLELIEEGDAALAKEALELSQQSARRASGRLQFFRVVFGSGGARQVLGLAEAGQLASGYLDGRKIALELPKAAGAPELPPGGGRMLLGLVMLAAECLARGGVVAVEVSKSGAGLRIRVVAQGSDAQVSPEIMAALGKDADAGSLTVGNIGAFFIRTFAARNGETLSVSAAKAGAVEFEAALRPA